MVAEPQEEPPRGATMESGRRRQGLPRGCGSENLADHLVSSRFIPVLSLTFIPQAFVMRGCVMSWTHLRVDALHREPGAEGYGPQRTRG